MVDLSMAMLNTQMVYLKRYTPKLTGAFYVGDGWVAGGCWDDYE